MWLDLQTTCDTQKEKICVEDGNRQERIVMSERHASKSSREFLHACSVQLAWLLFHPNPLWLAGEGTSSSSSSSSSLSPVNCKVMKQYKLNERAVCCIY